VPHGHEGWRRPRRERWQVARRRRSRGGPPGTAPGGRGSWGRRRTPPDARRGGRAAVGGAHARLPSPRRAAAEGTQAGALCGAGEARVNRSLRRGRSGPLRCLRARLSSFAALRLPSLVLTLALRCLCLQVTSFGIRNSLSRAWKGVDDWCQARYVAEKEYWKQVRATSEFVHRSGARVHRITKEGPKGQVAFHPLDIHGAMGRPAF
jgi:hypothetical protein